MLRRTSSNVYFSAQYRTLDSNTVHNTKEQKANPAEFQTVPPGTFKWIYSFEIHAVRCKVSRRVKRLLDNISRACSTFIFTHNIIPVFAFIRARVIVRKRFVPASKAVSFAFHYFKLILSFVFCSCKFNSFAHIRHFSRQWLQYPCIYIYICTRVYWCWVHDKSERTNEKEQ